ncbi:antirestriction protein [Escherichia coli]|uniref:Antirestriction protein n=1 Tax=Escherichia coli TaxID=562 RepID=A0A377KAR5_ECOLX|nr:antirestriction protein [Escherichia coli]
MQHVPEGVIQAPESPDAPEALPGVSFPFLMMTCAPGVPVCFTVPEKSVCAD